MLPVKLPNNLINFDLPPVSPDAVGVSQTYNRTLSTGTNRTLSDGSIRTISDKVTNRPEIIRLELPQQIISVEI
jgi:hypothetical protein